MDEGESRRRTAGTRQACLPTAPPRPVTSAWAGSEVVGNGFDLAELTSSAPGTEGGGGGGGSRKPAAGRADASAPEKGLEDAPPWSAQPRTRRLSVCRGLPGGSAYSLAGS